MIICEIWIQTRNFAVASGLTQEITEKALCFKKNEVAKVVKFK